jgi:hypothetical protein
MFLRVKHRNKLKTSSTLRRLLEDLPVNERLDTDASDKVFEFTATKMD